MKIKIKSRGKIISVKNNTALINWLRTHDSEQLETNEDYMQAYAKRKELFNGHYIRTDNTDIFVEDLVKLGYIELL